jgi:uncharacterized protein
MEEDTMSRTTRRSFFGKAAAGLAAAGLASRRISGAETSDFKRIYFRMLGSTGFKVSEIGMGCMNMRDPDLVHAAIDSGINYIDTANSYMNGVNEQVVGQVMRDRRDEVFLTTKIKFDSRGVSVPEMYTLMDTSLKRLNTDHVDLVLLHVTDTREQVIREDLMKVFDDFRRKGQTRFVGVSSHENQAEVLDAAVETKFWEAVLVGYNYYSPSNVTDSIQKAREAGLAIIGMKNLVTAGEHDPYPDIRSEEEKVAGITDKQALLKWVLDNPYLDTTIPGMTSFEQLADDVDVMGLKMTFEDRRIIRKYGEATRDSYCRGVAGCTGCLDSCPNGVPVCEINRCLNYAEGYGDIELAHENYRDLPQDRTLASCGDCDECTVKCVNGLDLAGNIRRARGLFT